MIEIGAFIGRYSLARDLRKLSFGSPDSSEHNYILFFWLAQPYHWLLDTPLSIQNGSYDRIAGLDFSSTKKSGIGGGRMTADVAEDEG